jgi:hypothetical protein
VRPRLWHYTTGAKFISIVAAKQIKRVKAGTGRRRAVWFTFRDSWEPTATKGIIDPSSPSGTRNATPEEMIERQGALVRLEVPAGVAPYTWADFRREEDPRTADGLEAAAREQGSDPAEWRLSYHDVPIDRILCVEELRKGRWVQVARQSGEGFEVAGDFLTRIKAALGIL